MKRIDEPYEVMECIFCGMIYDGVYQTVSVFETGRGEYICNRCKGSYEEEEKLI